MTGSVPRGVLAREWKESFEEIYSGAVNELSPPLKLFKKVYCGALTAVSYAKKMLNRSICRYGADYFVGYPDTEFYLPAIFALSGEKITKLGELVPILNRMRDQIKEDFSFYQARLHGEATAYAAEIIESLRYLNGTKSYAAPWSSFLGDSFVRRYGILLVDWTIPGFAVIMGRAKTLEVLKKIVQDLQDKGFMIFLSNEIAEQAMEANLKLGADFITFPFRRFTQVIHAMDFCLRTGLAFGGIEPGNRQDVRDYVRRRVRAFVLHLGKIDDIQSAAHLAAIFLGSPVITDQELLGGEQIPNWYLSHLGDDLVTVAMEVRGIKLKIVDIPVPINVSSVFEGEIIRKSDLRIEFGGGRTTAFELVKMVSGKEIEDGKIEVIGPEIDEVEEGGCLPLGIIVKIFGHKMQEIFEGVLERRIHNFINLGEGLWHTAQRDNCWLRISNKAASKGFQIYHYGELLLAKFKNDFSSIVDRVEIELITDSKLVEEKVKEAWEVYIARDERLRGLTDELVEEFYFCLVCQSIAPNHCCVITPERPGLCGAVSWLDAKASFEIDPIGPCRPIKKEGLIDEEKGIWESVNEYVYLNSNRSIKECSLYSLLARPMTSCGCFEAIMGIVPETNGVMISTRKYGGMTPCGMTFSTLAEIIGGGVQTPGFMGLARSYILSRKFIRAEGGIARIVWMPKELKEYLGERFCQRCEEEGLGTDFVEKIADETVGETAEEILAYLEKKKHPALTMDPLL
ncbi:MAG: acetyl-CoA decarbonylase/synthase complex subunit alpha/beta [Dethiobacteria bacterium]|nr:CO dehydrogenase/CO-methylating acetyl-CoA synthase complex subunit beta [Bacillota bacterium]